VAHGRDGPPGRPQFCWTFVIHANCAPAERALPVQREIEQIEAPLHKERECGASFQLAFALGRRWKLAPHAALQTQPFRNQNAIEQIENPLYHQCQQRGRNRAFENGGVIVEIQAA
jgi:hypothetical protein